MGVTSQAYTVDAGSDATISEVSGGGGTWTINGSTASLNLGGPYNGTYFDVAVVVSFADPGVKDVDLDSSIGYYGWDGPATLSSSKQAHRRKINPPAIPGRM